jgi:hypothetical protein
MRVIETVIDELVACALFIHAQPSEDSGTKLAAVARLMVLAGTLDINYCARNLEFIRLCKQEGVFNHNNRHTVMDAMRNEITGKMGAKSMEMVNAWCSAVKKIDGACTQTGAWEEWRKERDKQEKRNALIAAAWEKWYKKRKIVNAECAPDEELADINLPRVNGGAWEEMLAKENNYKAGWERMKMGYGKQKGEL